ncbi:hypothetical protein GQ53DRAFT_888319 [Thozetella sp. PMI_491]|nr:hypothetical protein GQ53DRAFT_888319 [Thozetella sp. PMI_491]
MVTSGSISQNSTFLNPILPGFHPDPSCIYVSEWDSTFFCASSSFNAFPGIPIHASKDLQKWKLIGHALNRPEQLPRLAETNRSTSGIWAPTLRFQDDTFYLVTTLVDDDRPQEDFSRWDNIVFKSKDPFDPQSWSEPVHFNFTGYDTSPFWDEDGKVYMVAAHAWRIFPGIQIAEIDLETGETGEWSTIWNGTGGLAPEGPHIYRKDGFYYLMIAEGGTGVNHMVTMARSTSILGPYTPHPSNPVLTNANTTSYFQTIGHAELFQDEDEQWWAVALSTRSGPDYINYPMGRETVLTPVTWKQAEWPVFDRVQGQMEGWPMPVASKEIDGDGPFITEGDRINFSSGSTLPAHFTYWRFPKPGTFTVSPPGHPNTLRVNPSVLNLTALNGNYAGPEGQAFVGRRQQDTLFTFSVGVDFAPTTLEEEAGVTVFLTQNHHLDLGLVLLSSTSSPVPSPGANATKGASGLRPYIRFRGESTTLIPKIPPIPLPDSWANKRLSFEIKAANWTHYIFSVGPADSHWQMQTVATANNQAVSWGFTGVLVGVYCTSNGGSGKTPAYYSNWLYEPQGQLRD